MVESISKIQQLLAESKFVEAQKESEVQLAGLKGQEPADLIELYFESLKAQSRPVPHELIYILLEKIIPTQPDKAKEWVSYLVKENPRDQQRLLLFEIQIAEIKGLTEELYQLISKYQLTRIEASTPVIPEFVEMLINKYFIHDFQLRLKKLVMSLMRSDLVNSENLIIDLILSCFERTSLKGSKDKLNSLHEVLKKSGNIYHLEMYKSFCSLMVEGVKEKKDYKKLIELVIYVEDFKLQALLLNTLVKFGLEDAAQKYAVVVKQNKDYSYVYFDKYYPNLKVYFIRKVAAEPVQESSLLESIELENKNPSHEAWFEEEVVEVSQEEILLSQLLKHQNFSSCELLDVAVSFLQSDLFVAAKGASEMAFEFAQNDEDKLKACYLKVTSLLKTGDYRSAVDVSFQALQLSKTQNDVLSFLYTQAEAYLKMKEYSNAKTTLKKILSIDSDYRLAKERLEKLNAL